MVRVDIVAELRHAVLAYRESGDAGALYTAVKSLECMRGTATPVADPSGGALSIVAELGAIVTQCRRFHPVRSSRLQAPAATAA